MKLNHLLPVILLTNDLAETVASYPFGQEV